jgi:hypothetical protein
LKLESSWKKIGKEREKPRITGQGALTCKTEKTKSFGFSKSLGCPRAAELVLMLVPGLARFYFLGWHFLLTGKFCIFASY